MTVSDPQHSAVAFGCACGSLRGHLSPEALRAGTRVICHCADCRAGELYHGQPDPQDSGVDLLQISPHMIEITSGAQHLSLLQLSPRGLYRWYAGCCGTPLCNTLKSPKLPFAGVLVRRLDDPSVLRPAKVRAFVPQAGRPPRHYGAGRMTYGLVFRMATALLSGKWRQTPFFDTATGKPSAQPLVITKEQRAALR